MQTGRWRLAIIVLFIGIAGSTGILNLRKARQPKGTDPGPSERPPARSQSYQRIVSLAPSITECLFSLGLGDRVVGVTNFCDYPPEALTKTRVGGYYDLNYEPIVALTPDLVLCIPEHERHLADLDRLDLNHVTLDHRRVETILQSLISLGDLCDANDRASVLVSQLRDRIQAVRNRAINQTCPRVLVCVGRNMGTPTIEEVYVAGRPSFYDELITLAGGINAYQGDLPYPMVSGEGLMHLDPEIIIDMVPDLEQQGINVSDVLNQWQTFADLCAVKNRRLFLFTEDYVVIPGPRFIRILEHLSEVIHPEGIE